MGLIDLKTDLKSLSYLQPGPIVKHKFDTKITRTRARLDDAKRVTGILTKGPGLKFLAQQGLLKQRAEIAAAVRGGANFKQSALAGIKAAANGLLQGVGYGIMLAKQSAKAGTGYHAVNPTVGDSYLKPAPPTPGNPNPSGLDKFVASVQKAAQDIGISSGNYVAANEVLGGSSTVTNTSADALFETSEGGANQGGTALDYVTIDKSEGVKRTVTSGTRFIADTAEWKVIGESTGPTETSLDDYRYLKGKEFNHGATNEDLLQSYYVEGEGDKLQKREDFDNPLDAADEDLIPFEFNAYTPGENTDKYIYFRAFLDSFSDNYSGEWNSVKYVGRAENFYNYNGFNRTLSFAFKAAAFSKEELAPIYNKLNLLAGTTAPTYGADGLFMRGTLTRLTIGDLISQQDGFITSVAFSWNTDYQWELNSEFLRVPHLLDVSCEFTPIHSFNPTFNVDNKFIGNNAG